MNTNETRTFLATFPLTVEARVERDRLCFYEVTAFYTRRANNNIESALNLDGPESFTLAREILANEAASAEARGDIEAGWRADAQALSLERTIERLNRQTAAYSAELDRFLLTGSWY